MNVLGIMNGTSIDGIDLVLCKIQKSPLSCRFIDQITFKFSQDLQNQLRQAAKHDLHVDQLAFLHHALGRFYAEICKKAIQKKKWKVDLIGVHGQTVFHAPPKATLQIGEASYLRAALDIPVVSDFRPLDLALGGQAAPLATLFHQQVLAPLARKINRRKKNTVAIQNLGGIGNVSYFGSKNLALAFDTGPANMLMDLATSYLTQKKWDFDKDGKFASKGIPLPGLVNRWMKHYYFLKTPPKSCGREEFGESFLIDVLGDIEASSLLRESHKLSDTLATLTEFTAISIANSYSRFLPQQPDIVVLCGGGAKNPYLCSRIQYHLPNSLVLTSDKLNWPIDAVEGAAFALLAAYRVWNKPSNLPQTTGALRSVPLGKIL